MLASSDGEWRAAVIATEISTAASETPDAFGFTSAAHSLLVKCKVSVPDFRADRRKFFRRYAHCGMGNFRCGSATEWSGPTRRDGNEASREAIERYFDGLTDPYYCMYAALISQG